MPRESVALQFHIEPMGHNCLVTVNGQTVERLQRLIISTAWDEVTRIEVAGILADGSVVDYTGHLLVERRAEAPQEAE
jgi:hypothetical protein